MPILPRGRHSFPFRFQLPESALACSFESRSCTVRYYVKVTVDIPYASPPQGMKYFTVIGPHIDCMDEQYLIVDGLAREGCHKDSTLGGCLTFSEFATRVKQDISSSSEAGPRT
ncbi:arrestin_N domain-containing protein [Trichonephila clavipes]|nr:arrestin_N domain-containing protein [Trichonephila clavipes]